MADTHTTMKMLGWPGAIVIGITILAVELLPIVLGTGENAVYDWSFIYITCRFILLPIACVAHVVANLLRLIVRRDCDLSERLVSFSSVVIPCGFLVFSYLYPLPMFDELL